MKRLLTASLTDSRVFHSQSLKNLQSKRNDKHLGNLIFRFQLAERLILKLNSIRDPASASRDGVSDLEHYINKNFDPDQRSRTKTNETDDFEVTKKSRRNSEVTINIRSWRVPVLVQRPTVFQIRVRNLKALSDRTEKVTIKELLCEEETYTSGDQSRRTRKSIRHRGPSSELFEGFLAPIWPNQPVPVGNNLIFIPGVFPLGLFMNVHY